MEYVYAALLLSEAGKEIDEKNILEVVKAAGFTPDEAKAKAVVASLKGVDIKEVIKNAQTQAIATAQPAQPAQQRSAEAQGKEKKEEKNEAQAAEGLANLFG